MANKVLGGTPKGIQTLCTTCRAAQRLRGINLQEVIYCQALPRTPQITFPVSECSVYDDKRLPPLYQMENIAWEVKSRNRGQSGFAPDPEKTEIVITPPERKNDQGAVSAATTKPFP